MPGLRSEIDEIAEVALTNNEVLTEKNMREYQRNNTVKALEQANWKVSGPGGAAELLGVRPTTLADRIRTLKIRKPVRR